MRFFREKHLYVLRHENTFCSRSKGTFGRKDGKKDSKAGRSNSMSRKEVSALLTKEFEKFTQKLSKQDEDDKLNALISSLGADKAPESPTKKVKITEPQSTVNTSALKTILRRVKNSPGKT